MSFGPWGEGDTLSPTNLNNRGGGPFSTTSTVNVSWSMFSASRNTTSIQSAINYAGTNNIAAIVIPQSYLPYSTSAISDIYTVHRLREGGSSSLDVFEIEAYGASTSGDAYNEITAAFSAASASPRSKVVSIGPATYSVSKPLIGKIGMALLGNEQGFNASTAQPTLSGTFGGGPVIVTADNSVLQSMSSGIITGTGDSYTINNTAHWFALSDLKAMELNGLSQLCVECYWQGTATGGTLINSLGHILRSGADSPTHAFQLQLSAGAVQIDLTTSVSGNKIVNSGSTVVNDNAVHHIAATYDGSTLRLFIDGALTNSTAQTGTVVQYPGECVTVGPPIIYAPEVELNANGANGKIDGVRIRNTATYTAAFTPSYAKWGTADANTLAQMNFDDSVGPCTKVTGTNGTSWLVQRRSGTGFGGANGFTINGVNITSGTEGVCTGIHLFGQTYNWAIRNCQILNCRNGIYGPTASNFYGWILDHIFIKSTTGKYAIAMGTGGGLGVWNNGWIQGFQFGTMLCGAGITLNNVFNQTLAANAVYGHAFRNEANEPAAPVLHSCNVSTEAGTGSQWLGSITFGGIPAGGSICCLGCAFESGNSKPNIVADNGDGGQFIDCTFATATTNVMTATGMLSPTMFQGCKQLAWLPWSDTTGTAVLGRIGPLFSSSTGSTLVFDASKADEWDLTLTSDVTQSSWQSVTYGQPLSGAIKMDSTGSRLFTWPTNSKGTATLSYGSSAINTFTGFYDGVNVILTSVRTGL